MSEQLKHNKDFISHKDVTTQRTPLPDPLTINDLRKVLAEGIAQSKKVNVPDGDYADGSLPDGFNLNTSYQETYRGHADIGHELDWDIYDSEWSLDYPTALHVFCIECKIYWIVEQAYVGQAVTFLRFSVCETCGLVRDLPHRSHCTCKTKTQKKISRGVNKGRGFADVYIDPDAGTFKNPEEQSLQELHNEKMLERREAMRKTSAYYKKMYG